MRWRFVNPAECAVIRVKPLDLPYVQAVEVLCLTLRTIPFAPAKVELDIDFVANIKSIEIFTAIASQLKHNELRIIGVVVKFYDELSFAKSLSNLLCFEGRVKLAADLYSHAHEDNRKSRERKRSDVYTKIVVWGLNCKT